MDVSFTNVLEGARQYFQGLPATSGSAEGPTYTQSNQLQTQNTSHHDRNQSSSSSYWLQQEGQPHQPTRERTPSEGQRPSSQHSDHQRPSSLNSQEPPRTPSSYQTNYPEQNTSQSFQFQRPQSREVPTSVSHPYQQHIHPPSPYHQPQSPQQVRVPSRQERESPSPHYHQLQPAQSISQHYPNQSYGIYQQRTHLYNPQTGNKSSVPTSNNNSKVTQSQGHNTAQDNTYMKNYANYSQSNTQPNQYPTNKLATSYTPEYKHSAGSITSSQAHRTTHNLPPIASLASVNYHSSRTARDSLRLNQQRPNHTNVAAVTVSSVQNRPTHMSTIPSSRVTDIHASTNSIASHGQESSNSYLYNSVTTVTTTYTYPLSTPSTVSYSANTHQNISQNYQQQKSYPVHNRLQQTVSTNSTVNHRPSLTRYNIQPTNPLVNSTNQVPTNTQKRESPLDLSVKTVRTPADSTLEDTDESQRNNKYFNSNRSSAQLHLQTSSVIYPRYEVYPNQIQRNLESRSNHMPNVGAPKVDFLPNFNVPALNNSQNTTLKDAPSMPYDKGQRISYSHKQTTLQNSYLPATQSVPHNPILATAVNSHNNQKHGLQKTGLPRVEFPPPGHGHKTTASYPVNTIHDVNRKRPADVAPLIPNKIPKNDSWKYAIDQQIEQKLNSYVKSQMQHEPKHVSTSRQIANGSYVGHQERPKENIPTQMHRMHFPTSSSQQNYATASHYSLASATHNQTYVPSASAHHYPGYAPFAANQQNQTPMHQSSLNRNNASSLINHTSSRQNSQGPADKTVLSLLRNSLEIKGAKEAQRKLEQDQLKHYHHLESPIQPSRPTVQQPTTDVTAPLQPKTGNVGRNNASPFTASSLHERTSNTPPAYKFHVPKAIDSIRIDDDEDDSKTDLSKQDTAATIANVSGPDLDGLAAFLAARIRTKAELKQVGSTHNINSNNPTNITQVESGLETERSLSPNKQNIDISSTSQLPINGASNSPSKSKERSMSFSPRRRLFGRFDEESNPQSETAVLRTANLPPRDKSGLRSSSETSIFDFPDSDSDTELPNYQKQSLEDMRRDRKTTPKSVNSEIKVESKESIETPRASSPLDNIFDLACDSFVEQLKKGIGKKRGRRKRIESEVIAMLEETVTKEKPDVDIKIKIEPGTELDNAQTENNSLPNVPDILLVNIKKEIIEDEIQTDEQVAIKVENNENTIIKGKVIDDSDSDVPLSAVKVKSPVKPVLCEPEQQSNINESKLKEENTYASSCESETECVKTSPSKSKNKRNKKETQSDIPKIPMAVYAKPGKKPVFGDGTDFYPGWEDELYKYKRALRMPPSLIHVTRPPNCQRLSTSLPDLDPCPMSPTPSTTTDFSECSKKKPKVKTEIMDSDLDSNCSFNFSFTNKSNYDSEEGGSVKSFSIDNIKKEEPKRKESNILDKLLERYGGKKRKKNRKKDEPAGPKIIPKAENPVELLPTPSLQVEADKKSEPVIKGDSVLLGFRKKTLDNFKDAFINTPNSILGVNAQFTTVVLKSRTRTETRVLKQKATIREVFGEDRPASAPPVTCVDDLKQKDCEPEKLNLSLEALLKGINNREDSKPKSSVDNKPYFKNRNSESFSKMFSSTKSVKSEYSEDLDSIKDTDSIRDIDFVKDLDTKSEFDIKSETPSLDGDEIVAPGRKKSKLRNMRRKFSSGFDYIRKKKKQIKKENIENVDSTAPKPRGRGRGLVSRANIESIEDIQKEIKTWVLNKGIGETHLHRSARLGYTDITAYCLEKMACPPSPKDNAGYTPLHEACSRGHLDIAKLLLMYGANVSESAQGGIRPLHEAVENGFVEIVRLLLSYGADPLLATYTGLTPLSLAVDDTTASLLQQHIDDIKGNSKNPWNFSGPASCFDYEEIGYDPLADVPESDPPIVIDEDEIVEFEVSETPLPNLYSFKDEPVTERWILLQDLSNFLKIKSRDALLKQINPPSSSTVSNKQAIREMKMADFLEQAHCCQFLNANEKINPRASKIALVKYTDRVKQLLNVENFIISER